MKAKFFFLGLCALALAACSIDEVSQINDTNAVTFKATTITRADVTTTNNLASFSVWAWNTADGLTNEFMDDVIATRNGTTSTFVTSPLYFWPTGSVDFYALTPATGVTAIEGNVEYAFLGGEINEGDDVNPNWTYSGYVAKAQIEKGNIVIDACIPSKPEEQIDLCYGVAIGKSSGSVPMNFRHALSQIAFKAKSANEAFEVKIADVSVCSVYKEGVFTITDQDTSTHLDAGNSTEAADGTQGEWELTTTDGDGYAIKGRFLVDMTESVVEVPTNGDVVELVDPNGTLMLLPQEVVAWDPLTDYSDAELGGYIRILCHVEEAGSQLWPNNAAEEEESALEETGAFWTDEEGVEYAEIAVPLNDIEWEQGYRYTYTIIFGEGLGYYPPDDPNADLEGTPVLDIITFDVTVDEFQDAEAAEEGQFDIPTDTDLSYIAVSSQDELVGAAHMGYQVIDVKSSITLEDVYVEFTQDCVLNLADGVTITATNATNGRDYPSINGYNQYTAAIYVSGGTLTINGGTVETTGGDEAKNTEAIWVDGGTVIINGGTFKGGSWNADPDEVTGSESAVFVEYGAAYIYGGTFSSGKWNANGYYVLNCMDTPYKNKEANIYVYGGTYENFDPSNCRSEGVGTNFVVDGYSSVDNGDDTYTVYSTTDVTTPTALEALIAAGVSEITVTEDIVLTDQIRVGSDLVLNLEASLTKESFADDANTEQNFFFWVGGGATLTINASNDVVMSSGGTNGNDADDWVGCVQVGGNNGTEITTTGHLIINGGTYNGGVWNSTDNYNSVPTIYLLGGTVEIYDGIFTGGLGNSFKSYGYKANVKDYTTNELTEVILNIYDNSREDPNDAWIYVYGGQFRNFDPECNAAEGDSTNFCAEGYHSIMGEEDADGNIWFTVEEGAD